MRCVYVVIAIVCCPAFHYAQQPPTFPDAPSIKLDLPPTQNFAPPPPAQIHSAPTMSIQPVGNTSTGPVKAGDTVRVLRSTIVRSGPSDQSYPCNSIVAGRTAVVLDLPKYGTAYTPIAAPDDCYSLIPEGALYILYRPKNFMTAPQPVRYLTETLIDGEAGSSTYLVSNYKIPKGTLVDVIGEKRIHIQGKLKNYCVIRTGGKEVRYVKTADLEGVEDAARQANQGLTSSPLHNNWSGSNTVQPATLESEHLTPQLAGQVQAADRAYQAAMRNGVWEDARTLYQYLLESDVMSIRILAKNRLEFIREWQQNPPVQTSAQSPQQNNYAISTNSRDPWVPGEGVVRQQRTAAPVINTGMPNPVKEVTIRPTPPAPSAPPSSPLTNIPVYNDHQPVYQPPPKAPTPAATPPATASPLTQPYTPQPAPQQRQPQLPATPPTAQRTTAKGKLHKAIQYSPNQLYYLTNSQGYLTYYIRATSAVSQQLSAYIEKNIEVEGMALQAPIDGKLQNQINVDKVKPLQ